MDNEKKMMQTIKAKHFRENNGEVLRNINILRAQYIKLEDIKYVMEKVPEAEFIDSINYLYLSEYILLRKIKTKEPADIADVPYELLEAKLSQKGIKLLDGILLLITIFLYNIWYHNTRGVIMIRILLLLPLHKNCGAARQIHHRILIFSPLRYHRAFSIRLYRTLLFHLIKLPLIHSNSVCLQNTVQSIPLTEMSTGQTEGCIQSSTPNIARK